MSLNITNVSMRTESESSVKLQGLLGRVKSRGGFTLGYVPRYKSPQRNPLWVLFVLFTPFHLLDL